MNNETKILLDEYKEEFKNYKAYLDANNWFDDVYFNERKGKLESTKLNTEVSIIDTIIKSTNKFKEDVGDDIDKKPIQEFIKLTSEIITRHIERVQRYKRTYPLDEGSVESEVEFHSDLFALITKTKVALSKLNIDENEQSRKSLDLFFGNQKAPLMMRKYLCDNFKVINDKTEKLEIDFSVPHINPATSNEMLINMKPKDIPKWDPNKHFFEQEISTIQFWEEERNKIINGINIGGYKLSPWLYWHTNVYKMAFGSGEGKGIKVSLFRDNEFFFDYMHDKAKAHGTRGVFMYGSRRFAKALRNDEKLYYSNGDIREIGDCKIGDEIIGRDGNKTIITGVYPQGILKLYKVTLADGREIKCCDEHLWTVFDNQAGRERVLPLKELLKNYKYERKYKDRSDSYVYNYYVPLNKAIKYDSTQKPFINPYYLGLWLGDGTSNNTSITTKDEEIISFLREYSEELNMNLSNTYKYNYSIVKKTGKENKLIQTLKSNNLINNKHIPEICFKWDIEDRFELLRGLMDSDGTCGKTGHASFSNANIKLFNDVVRLSRELGIGAYPYYDKKSNYINDEGIVSKYNTLSLFTDFKIFNLSRKHERHVKTIDRNNKSRKFQTPIVSIVEDVDGEATCIRVDNKDSTFLTTNCIVTHNSAGMTSRLLHGMWTIEGAKGTVQGFSKVPDLEAIITYANDAIQNMFPALKIPANSLTLEDGIVLGLKGKKVQDRYDFANLTIVNLEGGTSKKGTQKTAGATPDMFLLDEAGKGKCIPPWKAAIPSFAGGKNGTWRVVPLISGTAGEGTLSVDAELMLKDPETYSILPMDWDFLEEFVDPDHVTWKRNSFGFFIPAQMSLAAPDKIIMPFGDFLDKGLNTSKFDKDLLNQIDIHVTDWSKGKDFFEQKRNAISNDIVMLAGETNSFPLDPEDCYLTTEINKFPGLESKARKSFVEKHGLDGQKYRLYRDAMGVIHADMTTDPIITDYPYKGGNFDAPVVMLENPLLFDAPPPLGLYTIGFDDVKQEKSDGDSVISACVYKRGYEGGEWADRFVAWYDSRPDRKQEYYRTLYLIIKIFNARILMENADNGFLEWMELNHMDDVHIHFSTGVGLASEENLNLNKNRRFGWAPTTLNIYRLEQKLVMYAKEDNVKIGEVEGLSGIDRINYAMLLEEMYKYKKDKNADRIRTAGLALTLAQYYDKTYQYMKRRKYVVEFEDRKKPTNWKNTRGLSDTKKLTKW